MLQDKKIAVYVTGGIAAYKAVTVVRQFIQAGAHVRVAMTPAATKFVAPLTFQVLSKQEVFVDTFAETNPQQVNHIHLADWCDVAVVVPASANTIAKLANGIADNFVLSALLATKRITIIVPAMNENMWFNRATKRNVAQLRADGKIVMEPASGFLAEGYDGKGRLPEPLEIVRFVEDCLLCEPIGLLLQNKRVLITAGGTRERIDPVRFISNDSSGKMGYALARIAAVLGADVTLISTVRNQVVPPQVNVTFVDSAHDMQQAVIGQMDTYDIIVMVAAVSDYRVKEIATQKLKKKSDQDEIQLTLVKNPDILQQLGEKKQPYQLIVGFAAETQNVVAYAQEKLARKNADVIIANDVSDKTIGFQSEQNQVTLCFADGTYKELEQQHKIALSLTIWQELHKVKRQ